MTSPYFGRNDYFIKTFWNCLTFKEEREKVETAALDVIREEEERQKQAREEKEKLEKEAEAIEYFKKLDR